MREELSQCDWRCGEPALDREGGQVGGNGRVEVQHILLDQREHERCSDHLGDRPNPVDGVGRCRDAVRDVCVAVAATEERLLVIDHDQAQATDVMPCHLVTDHPVEVGVCIGPVTLVPGRGSRGRCAGTGRDHQAEHHAYPETPGPFARHRCPSLHHARGPATTLRFVAFQDSAV